MYTISIKKPSPDENGKPVFIEVPMSPVVDGAIKFTVDETMTDEITEIGDYYLQIHLYDSEYNTMSLPPFSFKVKELLDPDYRPLHPTADNSIVDKTHAGYSRVADEVILFSIEDGYIKTDWRTGDLITSSKLNKIENSIEELYGAVSTFEIEGLKDVSVNNKANGDSLVYDKTTDKWIPKKIESVTNKDIRVQLGPGGTAGELSTGDVLPKGTDLTSFIEKLLTKRIYPVYVKPTLSLSTNISLDQEYGSTISPTLTPNFIKNDAGEAVELIYKRNDSVLTRINTCNSYTDSNLVIKEKTVYSLTLNYGNGIAKEDNLGNLYQEGIIKAGSISANVTINAKYPYWGAALDSDNIPSASTFTTINKTGIGAVKNTQITVKTKPTSRTVVFAYDKALGDANKIRYVELNDDANMSAFTKTEVNIQLLDGSTKTYNVYYYTALIPFGTEGTFIMTI